MAYLLPVGAAMFISLDGFVKKKMNIQVFIFMWLDNNHDFNNYKDNNTILLMIFIILHSFLSEDIYVVLYKSTVVF